MRVALAQINSHLGHFKANSDKIIENILRAKELKCDLVLFPEAALFGYHPMDLLERESVVREELKYIKKIQARIPQGIAVVFGAFIKNPSTNGKPYFNAAVVLQKSKKPGLYYKELLPTYDVFDDARHIEPGDMARNIFHYKGKNILITICEDIWAWPGHSRPTGSFYDRNPLKKIKPGTVDLILNLSASPFFANKMENRLFVVRTTAKYLKAPMAYVNMVGGQDELIFDGGSFAVDKSGQVIAQSAQFSEELNVVDFDGEENSVKKGARKGIKNSIAATNDDQLRSALVLGLRDFVRKIGQNSVHLGLSGGIDSAVVACLAVEALGRENVKAYALPGPHSTELSLRLALKLAENLKIECGEIPITDEYEHLVKTLEKSLGPTPFGLMHENLQARLRGLVLMAISNKNKSLLLNTSNKSELAAGYGTLYGDLVGALSPIGDLLKRDVYALAKKYNNEQEIIPAEIIERAPSAELRPNQKDQDTLPPYDQLDQSVFKLVEKARAPSTPEDKFLLRALMASEFKRWQSPPILKVREHSFGRGRRMPIAHRGWF